MTKEEIDKFLADTKVYVDGKSEEIQKKLFSFGYHWGAGNFTEVRHQDSPFLYIRGNKEILRSSDMVYFSNHDNRKITAEEILSLEITEPDYRPFKNGEECWQEMLKHQPFAWLKYKDSQIYVDCRYVGASGIMLASFDKAYYDYTFADGTPFGIKGD